MIYIGTLLHVTNQEAYAESQRRHGEFTLIVQADSYEEAIEHFKIKIRAYRERSDLFEGNCRIYFIQLLEFKKLPSDEALMMSYKSYAGDPVMPFIGCSIPSDDGRLSCRIYNWKADKLEIDGYRGKLFLEF